MEKVKKFAVRVRGIILHEGRMLVVKHAPEAQFLALPGGHLDWKEDVKECLRREIVEELGVRPEIGRLLYVNNFIDADSNTQSVEFFFEITNADEYMNTEDLKRTHAYEIAEIRWAEPDDATPILPKSLWEDFKLGKILSDQVRFIRE